MNKKILIALVVIIVGVLVFALVDSGGKSTDSIGALWPSPDPEIAKAYTGSCKILVDASGSMKGYFGDSSKAFIDALTDAAYYTPGSKVYFVGKETPFRGNIADIIGDLRKQPNTATSEFSTSLKDLFKYNGMGFLVTDGIVSVGNKTSIALTEIAHQIAASVDATKAAAILKFHGTFSGGYSNMYDNNIGKINVIGKRPFYIIVTGSKENIRQLMYDADQKFSHNKPDLKLFFGIHDFKNMHDKNTQDPQDATVDETAETFNLNVALPKCTEYLSNDFIRQNLTLWSDEMKMDSATYSVSITPAHEINININRSKAAQYFLPNATFHLKIANSIPEEWRNLFSKNDTKIKTSILEQQRTFGLSAIVDGLREGFKEPNVLFDIKYVTKEP